MPENLKTKSCLIADHGLFVELAARLARDFGEVLYFTPWINAFPKAAHAFIGTGLDNVERVETFWDRVDDTDIVVFPDIYFSDWQETVNGKFYKPVWGHRRAENLELDRWGMRELQKKLDIGAPRTLHFIGVDDLVEYLEDPKNKDKWIKISCFRGDAETFNHITWHSSSIWIDRFRNKVGALADEYEFIVEDSVDGVELGYDGWTVKGQWPDASYWGIEAKALGYIGRFSPYDKIPKAIRDINDKLSPVLADEGAVGFCSFETRVSKDSKTYMIDPCMRAGSPPFLGTMEGYANLSEVIWEGSHGRLTPVKSNGKYVAVASICSEFALKNWVPVEIPPSIAQWVKIRNKAVINGNVYYVPTDEDSNCIGGVVVVSDSLEELEKTLEDRAKEVKGYDLEIETDSMQDIKKQAAEVKEYGIDFL